MNNHSLVHAWGGHGEGALYINGKKVSSYYTCGESDIVSALGFKVVDVRLNEKWFQSIIHMPENLKDCVLDKA